LLKFTDDAGSSRGYGHGMDDRLDKLDNGRTDNPEIRTDTPEIRMATGRSGEPYRALRKRNERRSRVALLLEAQRELRVSVERVVEAQRQRRLRHGR
jgi:hypothetical protein